MNTNEKANCLLSLANATNSDREDEVVNDLDPVDFYVVTRMPVESYKYRWTLNQFDKLSIKKEMYSPYICERSQFSCRLKVVKYENGFGLFHVYQKHPTNTELRPVTQPFGFSVRQATTQTSASAENSFSPVIEYQISVLDKHGKERMKWTGIFSEQTSGEKFIAQYVNNCSKHFYSDILILYYCVKVTNIPETEKQSFNNGCSLESHCWEKLSQDLKSMYKNSRDAGFTLVVETEEIRVNSSFLAARSPVFKKMFDYDKEHHVRCSAVIPDVSLPAMKRLVEFLYTGAVEDAAKDITFQEVYDLYYAADKYEVMDLRKMCGTTLMSKASVDNASKIFLWADRHSDDDLKSQILNFIRLNYETVVDSDDWRHLTDNKTKLANEALNFCAKKFKAGTEK
ncbi:speckle-type POZ protein B [Trichonephila clavipes]|nr:speckle-type POZ protein B [Trichonephila clavipes]